MTALKYGPEMYMRPAGQILDRHVLNILWKTGNSGFSWIFTASS